MSGVCVCVQDARSYPFVNTHLDSVGRLQELLQGRLGSVGRAVAELVGLMALKLSHDHILPLDVTCYSSSAQRLSATLNQHAAQLQVHTHTFRGTHHTKMMQQTFTKSQTHWHTSLKALEASLRHCTLLKKKCIASIYLTIQIFFFQSLSLQLWLFF